MKPARVGTALLSTLILMPHARADESSGVAVDTSECRPLDAREVERLLVLELSTLSKGPEPLPRLGVRLECDAEWIRIRVSDPTTDKIVQRSVPAPDASAPGAERIVALATSQLVLASWLEVLLPARKEVETRAPPPDSPAVRLARRAASSAIRSPTRPEVESGATAGVRLRDPAAPFPMWRAAIHAGAWQGTWWGIFGEGALELGTAQRDRGDVGVTIAGGNVGAWLRPIRGRALSLEGRGALGIAYLRFDGRPSRPGVEATSLEAAAGELSGELGPGLRLGPIKIGAAAQIGLLIGAPDAEVFGESPVSLGGVWLGGAIRVGLVL